MRRSEGFKAHPAERLPEGTVAVGVSANGESGAPELDDYQARDEANWILKDYDLFA